MSVISNNLKFLCEKYGYSHAKLARLSGIPQPTVTRTINGDTRPRDYIIEKLAAALGTSPTDLQTKDLQDPNWTPTVKATKIVWNEEDVRIEASDLYDHEKLKALKGTSEKANWPGPHVVGSLLLTMPTDELSPLVPRGATLYITAEEDELHPDATNGEEAIGITDEGQYTFGKLSIAQGKMFITPTNPAMANTIEVKRVTARVAGWVVIRQK